MPFSADYLSSRPERAERRARAQGRERGGLAARPASRRFGGPHLDLFDLAVFLLLAGLGGLLLLLVFVFAVIENLGHGRIGVRRYLDEVEPGFDGLSQRIGGRDHADVGSRVVDQADFADADIFVHPRTGWLALRRGSHWTTYVAVSIGCCTDAGSESRRNGQAAIQRNSESER